MDERAVRRLADELRAVAAFGLNFARPDSHDEERWQHVLAVAAGLTALGDGRPAEEWLAHYRASHFALGPQASGEAVVIRDGKLLLVRRAGEPRFVALSLEDAE